MHICQTNFIFLFETKWLTLSIGCNCWNPLFGTSAQPFPGPRMPFGFITMPPLSSKALAFRILLRCFTCLTVILYISYPGILLPLRRPVSILLRAPNRGMMWECSRDGRRLLVFVIRSTSGWRPWRWDTFRYSPDSKRKIVFHCKEFLFLTNTNRTEHSTFITESEQYFFKTSLKQSSRSSTSSAMS